MAFGTPNVVLFIEVSFTTYQLQYTYLSSLPSLATLFVLMVVNNWYIIMVRITDVLTY